MITFNVNGKPRNVDVPGDMPLPWTLRDALGMTGTKFGCGASLYGACTIQIIGPPASSCLDRQLIGTPSEEQAGEQPLS